MFVKFIKILVLPILHAIRKVLNILKKHMMPDIIIQPKKSYFTAHTMFIEEEEKKVMTTSKNISNRQYFSRNVK